MIHAIALSLSDGTLRQQEIEEKEPGKKPAGGDFRISLIPTMVSEGNLSETQNHAAVRLIEGPFPFQDAQQICMNGHQITPSYHKYPETNKKHCDICGKLTITKCPKCHAEIRGRAYDGASGIVFSGDRVPEHCENCGQPFPWTDSRTKVTSMEPVQIDVLSRIENICRRFHLIAIQLHTRHASRTTLNIDDEYYVQDLMHSLLTIYFDDIRKEEGTQSHAGKSSKMDFLLKDESTVVETKMTRAGLGDKELGEELALDIEWYQTHRDCRTLVCFVYDPEKRLKNPIGLEKDLSGKRDKLVVKVIVAPKGY